MFETQELMEETQQESDNQPMNLDNIVDRDGKMTENLKRFLSDNCSMEIIKINVERRGKEAVRNVGVLICPGKDEIKRGSIMEKNLMDIFAEKGVPTKISKEDYVKLADTAMRYADRIPDEKYEGNVLRLPINVGTIETEHSLLLRPKGLNISFEDEDEKYEVYMSGRQVKKVGKAKAKGELEFVDYETPTMKYLKDEVPELNDMGNMYLDMFQEVSGDILTTVIEEKRDDILDLMK